MDENNKAGGNKALIFASAVLIAVLLTLGIYWARASKAAQSAPAAEAKQPAETAQVEPAVEAGQPAEAAQAEPAVEAGQPAEAAEAQQPAEMEPAGQAGQSDQAQKDTESAQAGQPAQEEQEQEQGDRGSLFRDGYTLEQVVVMSRHNIRSPMSGSGSVLGRITPHQWFEWSSNASELSLRGARAEA